MTTTIRGRKNKMRSQKTLSPNQPRAPRGEETTELVGLAALLAAPAPGLFKSVAEVDAHIREGRGDWDDED